MTYEIKNEYLNVIMNERGAELWSVQDKEKNEYLWQGDEKYWGRRAPNLFPYVGRLTEGMYVLNGKKYKMDIHGFARDMIFEAEQISDQHIVFCLKNTEKTYEQYPCQFLFKISYELKGNKILITYDVENADDKKIYFGVGGHPGFCVPFEENTDFEDYYLEFDTVEDVKQVIFSEDCFPTGEIKKFPLKNDIYLPLRHELFDHDAIVLTDMSKRVTLKSDKSSRAISVCYPEMPYLGLWHKPKTDAPYICIEPWASLPSRKDVVEDFAAQPGLITLEHDKVYRNQISIEIKKTDGLNI